MSEVARLLFENPRLLILNKSTKVHSVRGKDKDSSNLQDWLETHFPEQKNLPESGILQRLDYLTTGCILVARELKAYENYREQMKDEKFFKKTYLALTKNKVSEGAFELYFRSRYRSSKKVQVNSRGTKAERGLLKIKSLVSSSQTHLWQVALIGPGKRHQIRAAFAHWGAPLIGDELYGGPVDAVFGLHSWKLKCDEFSTTCPPPRGWPKQAFELNI